MRAEKLANRAIANNSGAVMRYKQPEEKTLPELRKLIRWCINHEHKHGEGDVHLPSIRDAIKAELEPPRLRMLENKNNPPWESDS